MQSYPIWNIVTNRAYKGSKDFGAKDDGFSMTTYVGTSASNSHHFVDITIHRSADGKTFQLQVDNKTVKTMQFNEHWKETDASVIRNIVNR